MELGKNIESNGINIVGWRIMKEVNNKTHGISIIVNVNIARRLSSLMVNNRI